MHRTVVLDLRDGDDNNEGGEERLFPLEEENEELARQSLKSKVDLRRRLKELGGVIFAHEEASDASDADESSARVWFDPF